MICVVGFTLLGHFVNSVTLARVVLFNVEITKSRYRGKKREFDGVYSGKKEEEKGGVLK